MPTNMTLAMLREHLHGDVDEHLLHYVAANAHKVLYISLEQLCERAGITMAEAVNFFRAFGTNSFVAFKYILRKCLYYEVTDRGIAKRSLTSLSDESIRFSLQNLLQFSSNIAYDQIEQVAHEIQNAPEVDLLCAGPTQPLCVALGYQLKQMKIRSHIYLANASEEIETLSTDNLIIVFGFLRYNIRLLTQVKLLRQRGYRIVCITDSPDSPFVPLSDYSFVLANDSFDFLDSYISGMTFIHALFLALGIQQEEKLFSRMHAWDITTQETNMFW